jgi:hypothetical protein
MLIFNCSKSAAEFFARTRNNLKTSPLEIPENRKIEDDEKKFSFPDGEQSSLYQWQVHAIKADRKNCLVVMDIETRYSITLANLTKGDAEGFVKNFIDRLLTNMLRQGKELGIMQEQDFAPMLKEFTDQHPGFRFFQRSDRSVQSHINDVVWHFRNQIEDYGFPTSQSEAAIFDRFANELLRKTKGSNDYFTPSEEMILKWLTNYFGATEEKLTLTRKTLKDYSMSKFDRLFDPSEQLPIAAKTNTNDQSTAKTPLPDNVISLAAYRKQKI